MANLEKSAQTKRSSFKNRKVSPARRFALDVVKTVREREAYTHEVLDAKLPSVHMSVEDKGFASILALGVASTWGALDVLINKALKSPKDIDDNVRDALRISAYELFYLGKQEHAVVDQGVELVRTVAPRADKLANAVLRKMVRLKQDFPFGDPRKDISALALQLGFPVWMAKLLIKDLGIQDAYDLMLASGEQAPLFIGINTYKIEESTVLSLFEECEETLEPQFIGTKPLASCYYVAHPRILQNSRIAALLNKGCIFVSDLSAQTIASLVCAYEEPQSVLEIGAGRGTKTMLIQNQAKQTFGHAIEDYVTIDNHAYKVKLLEKRVKQATVPIRKALALDATELSPEHSALVSLYGASKKFDFVFLDAPCSGLGTLRRHPEIRWRLSESGLQEIVELQKQLLKAAARCVSKGGRLIYSTCTVTACENQQLIKEFLLSEDGKSFKLEPVFGKSSYASSVRKGSSDAHFAICLKRIG